MRVFLRTLWSSIKELRLNSCFSWNMELFCTQCQGIRPHVASRQKSHGFSRVASGTWDIFLGNGRDSASKFVYVQRHQDSCLLARDILGFSLRHGSAIGNPVKGSWRPKTLLYLQQEYSHFYPFLRGVIHLLILKHLSPCDTRFIKGM